MKSIIKKILLEEIKKMNWEYQVRDIGGVDVYYKRMVGINTWSFTDEIDFLKNSNKKNTIFWQLKKKYK